MRKVLLTILATAVLAGCSKDDVIKTAKQHAISFGNVFVENATKSTDPADPSLTTGTLSSFGVYGNVTGNSNTVNLFKGTEVSKDNAGNWNCGLTHYWVASCIYDFVAVSAMNHINGQSYLVTDPQSLSETSPVVAVSTANGMPSEIFYNAESQSDLLYAERKGITTDISAVPTILWDADKKVIGPVSFSFNHLLSKVKFTFTNSFSSNSGVVLTVKDIKIINAAKKGTYNISNAQDNDAATLPWVNISGEHTLNFGKTAAMGPASSTDPNSPSPNSENSQYCFMIPTTQDITITFTVNHNKGGEATPKSIVMKNVTFLPGHFYNFTAELNSANVEGVVPVRFTITIASDNWSEGGNKEVGPVYEVYN